MPHHPKDRFRSGSDAQVCGSFATAGLAGGYRRLDEEGADSIVGELLRRAEEFEASEVLATTPGEWRLIRALKYALKVHFHADDRFGDTAILPIGQRKKAAPDGVFLPADAQENRPFDGGQPGGWQVEL